MAEDRICRLVIRCLRYESKFRLVGTQLAPIAGSLFGGTRRRCVDGRSIRGTEGIMRSKWFASSTMTVFMMFAIATMSRGEDASSKSLQDAVEQSNKASKVFDEIMGTPDKAIPDEILEHAECV